MKISELFYSIQGEGKRSGTPSFFIRTNFCNLRCKFSSGNLCDTPYTSWNPNDKENIGEMNIDEIISKYKSVKCNDVVITGGEPAMYPDELNELLIGLRKFKPSLFITLETNGTKAGNFLDGIDLISVSPKLSTSTPFNTEHEKMHESNRINLEVLNEISNRKREGKNDSQWKFVFTGESDINEIFDLKKKVGFASEDIYLMPEGISESDLLKTRFGAVKSCMEYGWNYTERLHILIWGNKRGT